MPTPPGGKERATRLPLPADVRIRCAGKSNELSMVTRDISETGMFILSGDTLEVGTAVEVKISLPSVDDWSTTECELKGQVVRHDSGRGTGTASTTSGPGRFFWRSAACRMATISG